jgi:hypothetical protein
MTESKQEQSKEPEVPLDSATRELLLQQKKAEARKAIAEARKAEQAALLPDLSFTVPEHTVTPGEKGSPVAVLLGYGTVSAVCDKIAASIIDAGIKKEATVLIVDDLAVATQDGLYVQVSMNLARLLQAAKSLQDRLDPPPSLPGDASVEGKPVEGEPLAQVETADAVAIAGAVMSAVPGLLSLFRTNYSIKGRDFDIAFAPVAAAMARSLHSLGPAVFVRDLRPVPVGGVIAQAMKLQEARDDVEARRIWRRISRVDHPTPDLEVQRERLTSLRKQRDQLLTGQGDKTAEHQQLLKEIQELVAEIEAIRVRRDAAAYEVEAAGGLVQAIDAFLSSLLVTPTGQKYPPLVAAALHEGLHISGDDAIHYDYILFVEATFAGGESVYEERWGRDRAAHLGGSAVAYLLVDNSGRVVTSGVSSRLGAATHKLGETTVNVATSQAI